MEEVYKSKQTAAITTNVWEDVIKTEPLGSKLA